MFLQETMLGLLDLVNIVSRGKLSRNKLNIKEANKQALERSLTLGGFCFALTIHELRNRSASIKLDV